MIDGQAWSVRDIDEDDLRSPEDQGYCDSAARIIEILEGLHPRDRLDTIIHETIHALRPGMPHRQVYDLADTITRVLWRDGWRRATKDA